MSQSGISNVLPDEVLVLLNHIESVVDNENWEKIDTQLWNNVTALAKRHQQTWMHVEGNSLFISRSNWIYPKATENDAGPLDENRYRAIGWRDGDIVLSFKDAVVDAQDLATMLNYR